MMDHLQELFDHDVKIEKLLFFQGTDLHQSDLEDLISWCDAKDLSKALDVDIDDYDDEEVLEYFDSNHQGHFIAEVHTPVKRLVEEGKEALRWSWGTDTFTLIVAETFDELVEKSCAWADDKEKEYVSMGPV